MFEKEPQLEGTKRIVTNRRSINFPHLLARTRKEAPTLAGSELMFFLMWTPG